MASPPHSFHSSTHTSCHSLHSQAQVPPPAQCVVDICQYLETFSVTTWRCSWHPAGSGPGMLWDILLCTGQPPRWRITQPQRSTVPGVRCSVSQLLPVHRMFLPGATYLTYSLVSCGSTLPFPSRPSLTVPCNTATCPLPHSCLPKPLQAAVFIFLPKRRSPVNTLCDFFSN